MSLITLPAGLTIWFTAAEMKGFTTEFEVALRKKFLVSEVSDLNWFLGMQIRRDANKIEISQESNIDKLLENFGMSDAKTAFTPDLEKLPISSVDCPSKRSEEENEMKCCNYRGLIGSLNYLTNTSRPDITFVVRSLSRFVQNPGR